MSEKNQNHGYGGVPGYGVPYYPHQASFYYPAYNYMRTFPPQSSQGFPGQQTQQAQQQAADVPGMLPLQQSYIENILRLNRGKVATVYMTFENNTEYNSRQFRGVIEAAGRDHIILSDPETGRRYLLLMVYLDYVVFDEPINYEYPFDSTQQQMATYSPR